MPYRYVVLGAGMQGTAAAYDLALLGEAEAILLADIDLPRARRAAERVNTLARRAVATAAPVDVADTAAVATLLHGASAVLSAVPFRHNVGIARAAAQARANLCDLGGNTEIVFQELEQDAQARQGDISIVPDCGVMPGMGNLLAVHGMNRLKRLHALPREVRIYVGGLPQKPRPPLSYKLVFNIEGLIDLYVSRACVLREGQITQLEPLTELEEVDFPAPVGRCEACITSGGVSTCPWTFQDQLLRYEEKTVRYPGHFAKIKTLMDLGLLSAEPIAIGGVTVTPRELFGKVVAPRIDFPKDRDLLVLRVSCTGERDGQPCAVVYDLLDFHEEKTGFSAMERTTGFSAAIVASLLAQGKARKGAIPLETALSSDAFVAELARRDFRIAETVQLPLAPTQ